MVPEPANRVQRPQTIIVIRRFKNGWQCFEAPGVAPYWVGKDAKQSAVDYAKARAKYGHGEIRVFDSAGAVERAISFEKTEK